MRSVNVEEFENDLSAFLTYAKAGEEIILRDHDLAIARLVPVLIDTRVEDFTEEELQMAAEGGIVLPKKRINVEEFLRMPLAQPEGGVSVVAELLKEREEGW